MYVHIHIHDPLQDVYQVEKIKSGPLFLPSINDLQVVVLHPANRKSGMAEILDRQSRTSMEVSVFCPSALTQIQSWSGLGLSNPVEKSVGQLGIIIQIPTKSPTMDRKGRRNSPDRGSDLLTPWIPLEVVLHALWTIWGIDNGSSRMKSHLKPCYLSLEDAGRCWKRVASPIIPTITPQALSRYWFLMLGSWSSTCWCLGDSELYPEIMAYWIFERRGYHTKQHLKSLVWLKEWLQST